MSYNLKMMTIYKDKNYNLFDFSYNLYDNSLKPFFEYKFIQHFLLYDIAFDTVGLFKNRLQTKLNEIYPYYREMYKTEIAYHGMDLLNTKDVTDVYTREILSTGNNVTTSNNSSNTVTTENSLSSLHETPQNKVDDLNKFMTSATKGNGESTTTNTDSVNSSNENNSSTIEKYTYHSSGNLGVSSDGFLLEKWREIIINIDMMIFEELKELFLLVY